MKALWRGHIQLGKLVIPVRLYSASQTDKPQFVLLHETDGSPVERTLKCSAEGKTIQYNETIHAAETEQGRYVVLTNRELERAMPDSKMITIRQFCRTDAILPVYYEKPYYIVPTKGGERAYALLRDVMGRQSSSAIVQFILRNREHIGAVQVYGDMLVLNRLRFSGEIVPRTHIKTPSLPKPHPHEIDMLEAVIGRLSGLVHIEDYHDEHSEQLQNIIEREEKGLPLPRAKQPSVHATSEENVVSTLAAMLGDPTYKRL